MRYTPVIGLEIHVRLKTATKLFCRCENAPETTPPNTMICPVCTGQPGALPVLNEEAVRLGVRVGLALGGTVPDTASFDRKNYFYPDLPKGYQITQYAHPVVEGGALDIVSALTKDGTRRVGITRAHLEEDAAKNIHHPTGTLVDYNRASAPLLEIVTDPDLRSPQEAKAFLQELQALLRAIHASDADMEKGYMRCDANISLLPIDDQGRAQQKELNPKVEIKNMNSFRSVERALLFEIERQTILYEAGERAESETRGWDDVKNVTVSQRSKETNADYRYFPEPDLPEIALTALREEELARLPELPAETRLRLVEEHAFSLEEARALVERGWASYAEHTLDELASWHAASETSSTNEAKLVSNWLLNKLPPLLEGAQKTLEERTMTAENFAEFLHIVSEGAINSTNAQKLLALMIETGADPSHILEEHALGQTTNTEELAQLVETLIASNPSQAEQVRAGKEAVLKWFVGQVMKATEGRVDPKAAEEHLRKRLSSTPTTP